MSDEVIKIVFTGGPCGGKSTAIAYIAKRLQAQNIAVAVCTEAATALDEAGFAPSVYGGAEEFQHSLFEMIRHKEDLLCEMLKRHNRGRVKVLLCDRGLMDAQAYIGDAIHGLVRDMGTNIVDIRDRRYSAVIHMVTAADGAIDFYTTENNEARTETPEEAIALDVSTQNAWMGTPHLRVVDNTTNFQDKVDRVYEIVVSILGIPVVHEIERKFLVNESFAFSSLAPKFQTVQIVQLYLLDGARIRSRSQHGEQVHFHTVKNSLSALTRTEQDRVITPEAFGRHLHNVDPHMRPIVKERTCFVYNRQYCELDRFSHNNMLLLEIELLREDEKIDLPDFLPIVRDVSEEKEFSNYAMASAA